MNAENRNPARDDPLDGRQSTFLQGMQRSALGALLMTLTFATPTITLGIFLRDGVSGLMVVAALLTLVVWFSQFQLRRAAPGWPHTWRSWPCWRHR